MTPIRDDGLRLIAQFEGFSPVIYRCAAGVQTIGYGHVVRPHEDFSGGISQSQAWALLQADAQQAAAAVDRLISVPLTTNQREALMSFTFNLGAGALQRSSLRRCINRGEHEAVPAELMRWVWAGGRKLAGLMARRRTEGEWYGRGVFPLPLGEG